MAFHVVQRNYLMSNKINAAILSGITMLLYSCTPTTNISKYYFENGKLLDSIQESYKQQYKQRPFSIEFTDKTFKNISIEIFTDTLKYIYEFSTSEDRMKDTLLKYHLSVTDINKLISQMASVHCTWINNLDYYVAGRKEFLVFMSMRAKPFNFPFTNKKYYILTYFLQPQYYDVEGRLLDHKFRKKIRKINEDIFRRITDKVAYTISDRFR
ncbi:MAG: hypothetical protein JWO92_1266 [Chitinophagaceae bacterium]|nr:hypothetical protein [Chitinophagaceae bacterium]MDB5222813.1 hypothetical protein [Chitinophagaceae bacterium]